ncbi:hypothetical protein N7475_005272 [Penicillium sp. IBT 31633x]|nr:hypothetical protein N7475_005272 [Penicillium sp. IBT 31633x]
MAQGFPEIELRGDDLRRWMEDANEPGCPIPISTFTLHQVNPNDWYWLSVPEYLSKDWARWTQSMGLPVDTVGDEGSGPSYYSQSILKNRGEFTFWMGRSGPGVIFIDNIKRIEGSTNPYMSEYTKAFYELEFPLEGLKHVVVTTVIQPETMAFITDHLYPTQGLPARPSEPHSWEAPSAEFCGLLGTPIGKVIGAFVLGTYGQGVKRIARIVSFHTGGELDECNLRFDIADV